VAVPVGGSSDQMGIVEFGSGGGVNSAILSQVQRRCDLRTIILLPGELPLLCGRCRWPLVTPITTKKCSFPVPRM
jgi:hypothetical protein